MTSSVFHVRGLEEALNVYAKERLAGRANPTFTMDRSDYDRDAPLFAKSYTIHAKRADESTVLLRRVLLYVTPVDPPSAPTLTLT